MEGLADKENLMAEDSVGRRNVLRGAGVAAGGVALSGVALASPASAGESQGGRAPVRQLARQRPQRRW